MFVSCILVIGYYESMAIDFQYESKLKTQYGYKIIAGVDEVGRGPLAGPVTAGAFIFLKKPVYKELELLRDSKLLSAKQRGELLQVFCEWKRQGLCDFATYSAYSTTIDKSQIHRASVYAMRKALNKLQNNPDFVAVDKFLYYRKIFNSINFETIKGADNLVPSCAAASIVAKVRRDKTMINYHKKYPEYRFDLHKGYGTKLHREMIKKYGPCKIHRNSFKLE